MTSLTARRAPLPWRAPAGTGDSDRAKTESILSQRGAMPKRVVLIRHGGRVGFAGRLSGAI